MRGSSIHPIITLLVLAGALAAALVLVTTGTFGSGVASGDDDPAGTTTEPGWRYIAKVVCVPELGPTGPVLVPGGKYRTAVNVDNPWDWDVALVKWLTLSRDQGIPPIVGSQVHTDLLPPGASFDVDCTDMKDTYGLPDGAKVPGGKGHLWIEANDFLQVNTVYTTKKAKGGGISIEVEEVYPWPVFGPPVNPGAIHYGSGAR